MKVNTIGFNFPKYSNWRPSKRCVIHAGRLLIPFKNENGVFEPNVLMCPDCGTRYLEHEATNEEGIQAKFSGQSKTMIVSAKGRAKKYYDSNGNLISDPELIQEVQRGAVRVISYHEEKSGEDVFKVDNKHLVRKTPV
jgi:hypothetical protein